MLGFAASRWVATGSGSGSSRALKAKANSLNDEQAQAREAG